jgi:hypothetical protein
VRVKRPFVIGSRLTIKWRREQFSAIAKNCRREGRDFLLGVRREASANQEMPQTKFPDVSSRSTDIATAPVQEVEQAKLPGASTSPSPSTTLRRVQGALNVAHTSTSPRAQLRPETRTRLPVPVAKSPPAHLAPVVLESDLRSRSERKVMQPKSLIPQFWRRQHDEDAPAKTTSTEAKVTKTTNQAAEHAGIAHAELLSYEDIYRAAGIMGPGSGYDIHKVVDMLNSERIRDLSNDVKRASVLMALDAAGIAVNDLLTDATRRQNALNSYEAAQRKQLEDFEAQKAQENSRIEGEMERIRVHYAERIQKNLDLVAKEKESLRNWQSAMQHESQRIAEVIDLCGKPAAPRPNAMAAAAGSQGTADKPNSGPDPSHGVPANPLAKA